MSEVQICDFASVQGVDPDAPEEDEDNDVEDADGDQDETELLWVISVQWKSIMMREVPLEIV